MKKYTKEKRPLSSCLQDFILLILCVLALAGMFLAFGIALFSVDPSISGTMQ